jgi:hypothetical protein
MEIRKSEAVELQAPSFIPPSPEQVFEEVGVVNKFTLSQIDNEIAMLQRRIDELQAKRDKAINLKEAV